MKHRHFSRKVWHHRKHLRNKSLDGLPKLKLSPQLCLFVGDALHQILINCTILNDLTVLTSLLNHIASNILKPTLLLLYRSLQPKPFLDPTSTTTDIRIRCFPYLALPEFDFHPGVSMHHLHFGTPNRPNPGQNLPCHHRVQGIGSAYWFMSVAGGGYMAIPDETLRLVIPKYAPLNPLRSYSSHFLNTRELEKLASWLGKRWKVSWHTTSR